MFTRVRLASIFLAATLISVPAIAQRASPTFARAAARPSAPMRGGQGPKTVTEMGRDLQARVGRNRVSIATSNGVRAVDLAGKSHGGIPTPHVHIKARGSPNRTVAATKADVRAATRVVANRANAQGGKK